jgi:DNA-binding response OmpR family regulator
MNDKINVVVCTKDKKLIKSAIDILASYNHEVLTDVDAVLKKVAAGDVDVVLFDTDSKDGLDNLVKLLQNKGEAVRVLGMSKTPGKTELMIYGQELPMDACLKIPLNTTLLRMRINRCGEHAIATKEVIEMRDMAAQTQQPEQPR